MKKLIGYGYTNSQGVATLDYDTDDDEIDGYVGTGAGLMNFRAEMHDDSSVVTQTYIITDCIFYDPTTSDQKSNYYWNSVGGTSVTYSNGLYILNLGTSANYVDLRSITDNVKGKTVNFEVAVVLNGASVRTRIYSGSTLIISSAYTTIDSIIRLENVEIPNDATSIIFRLERRYTTDGDSIKFKNFKIYSV